MAIADWTAAIGKLPTLASVDELTRAMWGSVAAGEIGEADAETLSDALGRRRTAIRAKVALREAVDRKAAQGPSLWQHAHSRDRVRSVARRRQLAATGPLPPALASHFTLSELAVLRIVGDACRREGACDATLGEIAARAGVGRTTAQGALRLAARLGLVRIVERRRPFQRSLSNVVTITSAEWSAWLRHGPRWDRGSGFGKATATDTKPKKRIGDEAEQVGRRVSGNPWRPCRGRAVRGQARARSPS